MEQGLLVREVLMRMTMGADAMHSHWDVVDEQELLANILTSTASRIIWYLMTDRE